MHSTISVENGVAMIHVYSGWGKRPHECLTGSTYPCYPAGTLVERITTRVPDGLHALSFRSRVDEPRRMGSGKTAYLDRSVIESSAVLLCWHDGAKVIVKNSADMTTAELSRFNPFLRSETTVTATDGENRTLYYPHGQKCETCDPSWTYKSVSMDALLMYITRHLSLSGLDEQAEQEQEAFDEMEELRLKYEGALGSLESAYQTITRLKRSVYAAGVQFSALQGEALGLADIVASSWLYRVLSRLPARLIPKSVPVIESTIGAIRNRS